MVVDDDVDNGFFVVVVVIVDVDDVVVVVDADEIEMKEGSMVFASPHNRIPSKMNVCASLVDDHKGAVVVVAVRFVNASNF